MVDIIYRSEPMFQGWEQQGQEGERRQRGRR
jgi:hypothetical protein